MKATAFAPGSIGNVGPGFDVLGLAVEGLGDRVTVELTDGEARIDGITGVDAALVPLDPQRNAAAIAAIAWLRAHGDSRNPIVTIDKGLPLSGGLGGSAASSVAGAFAAALAAGAIDARSSSCRRRARRRRCGGGPSPRQHRAIDSRRADARRCPSIRSTPLR